MPSADPAEGVEVKWSQGDKTLIQVDMSALVPANTGFECMSLYRYLLLLEKQKKVTRYELSYSKCSRASSADGDLADSFQVEIADPHKYKTMPDVDKTLSCKSFFHDLIAAIDKSDAAQAVFRWRFERVHALTKVQKPYVAVSAAIKLNPGQPVRLSKAD